VCNKSCSTSAIHEDDCDLFTSLGNIADEPAIRFKTLVPCLGAAKFIRICRKGDPVSQLVSGRADSFQIPDWEEEIVNTLTQSKFEGESIFLKLFFSKD
jgi:hypothetical protein